MKNQDSYENKNQTSQSLREVGGNQMELEQNRISLEEREHMGTGSNNGSHFVSYSGTPSCISDSDKDTSNIHANNQNIIDFTEQDNQSGGSPKLKMIWQQLNDQNKAIASGTNFEDSSSKLSLLKNDNEPVNYESLDNALLDYVECPNNDFDGTLNSQNQPLQEPYIEFPSSEANSVNSNYSQHSEPVVKKLSPRSILALDDADYELEKAKMKNEINWF